MFDKNKVHFLFKCEDCSMIVSIELEYEEDLEKVREGDFVLDCQCGFKCYVLRN